MMSARRLPGEIGDARVQGTDQAAHALRRAAAVGPRKREELAQRHADDLGGFALHLPGRGAERAGELR